MQGGQASTPHLCLAHSSQSQGDSGLSWRVGRPAPTHQHPRAAGIASSDSALALPEAGPSADSRGWARVPGCGRVEAGSPS